MDKINENVSQITEIHQEFKSDLSNIKLDEYPNLAGWKAVVALPFVIGCGLLLGILTLFFFTEIVFTKKIFYAIPFFVLFCFILGFFLGPSKDEN